MIPGAGEALGLEPRSLILGGSDHAGWVRPGLGHGPAAIIGTADAALGLRNWQQRAWAGKGGVGVGSGPPPSPPPGAEAAGTLFWRPAPGSAWSW